MRLRISLAIGCNAMLLAVAQPGATATGNPVSAARMDIVTHNEVIVNAPPASVWPHALRMETWKKGVQLILTSGSPERIGAKFKAVYGSDEALFHAENVEVVPEQARTIRLNELDGTLIGFASLRLSPRGSKTLVQYDVYTFVQPPPVVAAAPPDARQSREARFISDSETRFDEELATLKRLAETGRR